MFPLSSPVREQCFCPLISGWKGRLICFSLPFCPLVFNFPPRRIPRPEWFFFFFFFVFDRTKLSLFVQPKCFAFFSLVLFLLLPLCFTQFRALPSFRPLTVDLFVQIGLYRRLLSEAPSGRTPKEGVLSFEFSSRPIHLTLARGTLYGQVPPPQFSISPGTPFSPWVKENLRVALCSFWPIIPSMCLPNPPNPLFATSFPTICFFCNPNKAVRLFSPPSSFSHNLRRGGKLFVAPPTFTFFFHFPPPLIHLPRSNPPRVGASFWAL